MPATQVFDKWQDDTDTLAAAGVLPISKLLQLSQIDQPGALTNRDGCSGTFLVPMQLQPGSAAAAALPLGRSATLQVSLRYSSTSCYSLDALSPPPPPAGGADSSTQQQRQQLQASPPPPSPLRRQLQQQLQVDDSSPLQGLEEGDGLLILGRGLTPQQATPQQRQEQWSPALSPAAATGSGCLSASAGETLLQQQQLPAPAEPNSLQSPEQQQRDPSAPLTAELCVEIIRACGLQAAVHEAEGWLGGASGLLGRARQLGPHPFVTVTLPVTSAPVHAVRTPFQVG